MYLLNSLASSLNANAGGSCCGGCVLMLCVTSDSRGRWVLGKAGLQEVPSRAAPPVGSDGELLFRIEIFCLDMVGPTIAT